MSVISIMGGESRAAGDSHWQRGSDTSFTSRSRVLPAQWAGK